MTEKRNIKALTGLRGFAALLVFVTHASHQRSFLPRSVHIYGQVGVMLFFVLSGFLLGYLYLERSPSRKQLIRYSAARIGRVVPLYLAVVLLSYALVMSVFLSILY